MRKLRTGARWIRRRLVQQKNLAPQVTQFETRVCCQLWRRAAADLGLPVTEYGPVLVIGGYGRRLQILRHLISTENNFAAKVCWDKVLTNKYLNDASVRIPRGKAFAADSADAGVQFGMTVGRCVVKPARDTGFGAGVSVNLTSPREIRRAFHEAACHGPEVLVEEFIAGENFRFLVYDGHVLSGVAREFASVTGDGKRTIEQLVSSENARRVSNYEWTGGSLLMPLPTDRTATAVLKQRGCTWKSVPPQGTRVLLSNICNYQYGSSYREVIDETHPAVLAAVQRATTCVGAMLAGVDVISADITGPDYWVNEVNTGPLVLIHYAPEPHLEPLHEILRRHFEIDGAV